MKKSGIQQQEAINAVESKVLSRLKQEASFIGAYKNMDGQHFEVERQIEQ
jgi:hypothetical protein